MSDGSSVWLESLVWSQDVGGSNPPHQTNFWLCGRVSQLAEDHGLEPCC